MAPVVVPALLALDRELTSVAPRRTLPTWYKGDPRHQLSASGHNPDDTPGSKSEDSDADSIAEIRAGDYRLPLNAQFTAEQLVQYLVKECRAGRITWIKYIIFNRRIWTASNGWVTQKYNGSNPHDKHFHLSCKPQTVHENNTKPVGLKNLLPKPAPKPPTEGVMDPEVRKAGSYGLHDALYCAASGKDFNGLPYGSPGSVGRTIRNSLTLLIVNPIIDAIKADDNLDEAAVAALLAPMVVQGVVDKLPTDLDDVTVDELRQVFRDAFLALEPEPEEPPVEVPQG